MLEVSCYNFGPNCLNMPKRRFVRLVSGVLYALMIVLGKGLTFKHKILAQNRFEGTSKNIMVTSNELIYDSLLLF